VICQKFQNAAKNKRQICIEKHLNILCLICTNIRHPRNSAKFDCINLFYYWRTCHITGCALAQHCCKGDQPFQLETPKFNPSYFPNPLIFPHQNLRRWLRPAYLLMCKIWWKLFTGGFPTNRWNITLAWLFVPFLFFPFLPFLFILPSSTGKTTELILMHDASYDAVSRKEVPFGVTLHNVRRTLLTV